ncbi:aromatic aminobenezylarsenical efflux permease ArsG family transporter [Shewanella sp. 1CM18E]|uniref:aromatic aminobenezylarsenical efflux permease ArsG family transporter n=1 Tax=Shewanella sp. 1CM18E TaxID=2929169 RepID=UPI0020C0E1A1|nr:aromatic aminobenezylarsenical efflux permease ArsG family transporter [Shewanella sp. 1CM18E]MCK8045912.1 aromatic aminobenezylarsenical efflux permease ArsG family transporter [Shewanella sp. 1CM18E]
MVEWLLILSSALWFGVLTSISPCPLATNVAAVSFLSKQVDRPSKSMMMGAAYSAGRMLSYILLAAILLHSAMSAPKLSNFLQTQMNMLLGPVLLFVGACLLGWIRLPSSKWSISNQLQQKLAKKGQLGAFSLGALFALSFCPTSAALFFASLLPLAVAQQSSFWIPAAYGIGTAMPVLILSLLLAVGTVQIGNVFNKITAIERFARILSGVIFIAAGIYYCWFYLIPLLE